MEANGGGFEFVFGGFVMSILTIAGSINSLSTCSMGREVFSIGVWNSWEFIQSFFLVL